MGLKVEEELENWINEVILLQRKEGIKVEVLLLVAVVQQTKRKRSNLES